MGGCAAGAMRVTLIRHAEAGDDAPRDEVARADRRAGGPRRAGSGGRSRGGACGSRSMVTSPLVRAVQTAEIVAAAVGYRGRILSSDLLVLRRRAAGGGRVPRASLAGREVGRARRPRADPVGGSRRR